MYIIGENKLIYGIVSFETLCFENYLLLCLSNALELQGILFAFVLINILNMNNSNNNQIIRFDWAMKRLLRNKANFSVLEGLLTTLLGEKIVIQKLLESESNQEDKFDK